MNTNEPPQNAASQNSAAQAEPKKTWTRPAIKRVPIFFECTAYAAAE